jgi:hypothetical protein
VLPICIVELTNVLETAIPDETVNEAETDCEFVMPLVEWTAPAAMKLSGVPIVVDDTVNPTVQVTGVVLFVNNEMLLNVIIVPTIAADGSGCPDCWQPALNVGFGTVAKNTLAGRLS